MKGTYNINLKLSTESKDCAQKVSQKGPRICQCNQLHKFTTFDTNIASEVKIRLENGLYNLFNCFVLPGKLENGWGRTFSWSPLRAALNVSEHFDWIMQKLGGMLTDD